MFTLRRIQRNRAAFLLAAIVVLCLSSLGVGFRGAKIFEALRSGVSVVVYPFQKGFRMVEDALSYTSGLVFSYHEARKEVQDLKARLAETTLDEATLRELWAENRRLRTMLDFQRAESRFVLLPAKVIGRFEGTLVIDVGELQGIVPMMCAITPDGVVGVVAKVEPFQSYVYTLHNAECRVGAMIARNRVMGMVHGSGSDFTHICRMQYIDMKDDVQIGDLVVTSGGPVFPPNIPIGKVTARFGGGALLQGAYVEPSANIYAVEELFLLKRFQRNPSELTGQEESVTVDESRIGGDSLPDLRTLQEQLAP